MGLGRPEMIIIYSGHLTVIPLITRLFSQFCEPLNRRLKPQLQENYIPDNFKTNWSLHQWVDVVRS